MSHDTIHKYVYVCMYVCNNRFACRRANKTRSEALAYYNMGVLHDNDKEFEKANNCYNQYLKAARAAGDAKVSHICMHAYIHTYVLTRCDMHTHTHKYIRTYTHAYIHIYIHTFIQACIHAYIHIYIHTYIHTYMHTYIHTCIHIAARAAMHAYRLHACLCVCVYTDSI